MKPGVYRFLWIFLVLISASLACQLVSGIGEVKSTAEALATEAKGGVSIAGTARAMITEIGSGEMVQTAQALATEAGESGLVETAIAAATEEGPGLLETAQAFATESPEIQETMDASMGEAPDDIPIIQGEQTNLFTSEFLISYEVSMSFDDALQFYEDGMPASGWIKNDETSMETGNTAILNYEKDRRTATVMINLNPVDSRTIVMISLGEK
jgi:hypothetical protein